MSQERVRFRPEGELSIYTAADSKVALLNALAGAEDLEIDLASVTEIDTAGVQLLILLKREANRQGKRLVLTELYHLAGWFGDPLVIPAGRA